MTVCPAVCLIPLTTTYQTSRLRFNLHSFILPSVSKKAVATPSSTLAWKIPWAEEPGELQSMGSLRVGGDWATSLSLSVSCLSLKLNPCSFSDCLCWIDSLSLTLFLNSDFLFSTLNGIVLFTLSAATLLRNRTYLRTNSSCEALVFPSAFLTHSAWGRHTWRWPLVFSPRLVSMPYVVPPLEGVGRTCDLLLTKRTWQSWWNSTLVMLLH